MGYSKKGCEGMNKTIYPKIPLRMPLINTTMAPKGTISFLWCDRRTYRLSVLACIHRKCRHLREKQGLFACKYKSRATILLEKMAKSGFQTIP